MLSWVQYTFKIAALSWSNSGVPDTVYETKKVDSQPQQPQQTPQLYPATITFWYWAGVFLSQTNTDMHVCSQTHRLKATVKRSRLALEPKEDLVAVIVDIMYQSPFACMHACLHTCKEVELGSPAYDVGIYQKHYLVQYLVLSAVWVRVATVALVDEGTTCRHIYPQPQRKAAYWRLTRKLTKTDFVAFVGEPKEPSLSASPFDCVSVRLCVGGCIYESNGTLFPRPKERVSPALLIKA